MTENSKCKPASSARPSAVFLTGRFRSGSTLLWNIFRNVPSCVAYYEPLHDMLLTHIDCRTAPTQSHPGVASYWDEYYPILERLRRVHNIEFGVTRLHMGPAPITNRSPSTSNSSSPPPETASRS